ncbi:Heterokaryon incompatibility protein (HET) domain containing protein [Hyaloscypha variabilis]
MTKELVMLQDRRQERIEEQSSMSWPADDLSDGSQNLTFFQYTPLEPSDSSIRLVVLESHKRDYMYNQEIRCRIVNTTFGAKPKYEAVSYSWGTEVSKQHIKMNGHRFQVSSNLFDALLHLGSSDVERTFWIDAICINQKDIDERNSQIQLMPFIYKRAKTVVVWLVIYRLQSQGWEEFVSKFPCDDVHKFKKLRQERYSNNRLLRNLLKDHQSAQCKDPRDKIYGLVGMSTDCSGCLPMDYRKSLWEVYKDVISVYHGYPEILELSRLLKQLIGGPEQILAQDIEEDGAPEHSPDPERRKRTTVMVPSCFLGTIIYVGPSYKDVIASPQKPNEWDAAVEERVNKRKPETREQSDMFLEALEDTDEVELNAKLSLNRKTSWHIESGHGTRVGTVLKSEELPIPKDVRPCPGVSLFLVHNEKRLSPKNGIGICCKGAKVGDFVFRIPNYGLAMVVRYLSQKAPWKLVGYAGIAMTAEEWKKNERINQGSKLQFDVPVPERLNESNILMLCLDITTLYRMSD